MHPIPNACRFTPWDCLPARRVRHPLWPIDPGRDKYCRGCKLDNYCARSGGAWGRSAAGGRPAVPSTCRRQPPLTHSRQAHRAGRSALSTGFSLGCGRAALEKRIPAPATAVTEQLDGGQRMRCVAKGLGRGTKGTTETAPHSLTIAESRLASNFLDRQPALLQHEPGGLETQVFNCLCRRKAGFSAEHSTKLSRA